MIRDIYNIDLEIPNSGIFIKGLDNEKLTISLDLVRFMQINKRQIVSSGNKLDVGKLAKPLNPYIIYNILEENNKNNFNGVKIIEKIEDENNIIYHFNFGLILNTFIEKSKITRQMEQNTSDNLKDLNEIKAFIAPCFFSYGMVGDVKSIPKNELEDLENDYGYEGKDYKSIFKKEVYINFSCYERVYFSNCEFKSKVSLHIINNDNTVCFLNGMDFSNCIFEDEINFKRFISGTSLPENKYYNNEQDTLFKNCIFKKRVVFHNSNFFNSIYFNNSHFKDYVDFHECRFEKTTCFYGVTFDKGPNFSQVIFKENLNAVNANLNFTFNGLKIQIKKEEENFNKDKNEQYQKSLDKFANDFRDSFRVFKNALIKDNNLLEASNFHKYELYCKEIELKNKKGKTFKDVVDKYQLFFYRKLCDHHTDLLKVFHNLLIIIMLFSIFSFVLDKFKQPSIENNAKYHIVQVDTNESYIFKEHNKTTYNFLSLNIEQEFKNLSQFIPMDKILFTVKSFIYENPLRNQLTFIEKFGLFLFFALLVILVALLIKQYLWFLLLPLFVGVVYCIGFSKSIITHFMIIMLFACTFILIMVFDSKSKRFLFVGISYIVCIFTLLAKPSLMLPVFGSFLEKDTNTTYPLLLSLSVVYFILVALVIFSLQKTARKNSIVPS
ncbi:TPA: pentapeptide repeat-containing protein [Campylobacter lari]|uniref:pentapeptide repeat-containing protein n=1 Tax=Campylobacter sp. IFREMER_LSEM_CL1890 TaxID=2911615 RepID=UPI0021E65F68|nr:pentapeptide repeat-containing protein [Campylobacter sp. IFREMER_LSEM_CL1890]MCV3409058.1 pentapeptide repeat-containing protein [Campylobacter sp. IFREMER_LSEM_CL1890]HEC1796915.1 pentapeptide repeat-containing protein [Campylobacter lari]